MRQPPLDIGMVGRVAGLVAVAAAIVATAVHWRHDDVGSRAPADATITVPSDPLSRELARCQAIGMAAKDDAACKAAWAENRHRFFTYRASPDRSATTPAVNSNDAAQKLEGK